VQGTAIPRMPGGRKAQLPERASHHAAAARRLSAQADGRCGPARVWHYAPGLMLILRATSDELSRQAINYRIEISIILTEWLKACTQIAPIESDFDPFGDAIPLPFTIIIRHAARGRPRRAGMRSMDAYGAMRLL